jgi:hypothetical protein
MRLVCGSRSQFAAAPLRIVWEQLSLSAAIQFRQSLTPCTAAS